MDLKESLKLDKGNLDDQALEQASLYYEWAEKHAQAVLARDKAKENLTVITADASADIRKNAEKYGWDAYKAPTETFINSKIPLHKSVSDAQLHLIDLQYEVNLYQAAKDAIEQRGRALDITAKLFTAGYFSANRGKSIRDNISEKSREKQVEALNAEPLKPSLKRKA